MGLSSPTAASSGPPPGMLASPQHSGGGGGGGSAWGGVGSFGPARRLHAAEARAGKATRRPHPARAPGRLPRPGSRLEGPVGTRRRTAAAGREGRPGSQGLPAATQILTLHLRPGQQSVWGRGGQTREVVRAL